MEEFYESTSNYSLSFKKITECLSNKYHSVFHSFYAKYTQLKSRFAIAMNMNTPSLYIVKLQHLHKSYNELEPHKRNIFTLYVKGYEISEICAKSGAKRSQITYIVHHTIKDLPKQEHLS